MSPRIAVDRQPSQAGASINGDVLCVRAMLKAAKEATEFVRGCDRAALKRDEKLTMALTWLVGVIGRAAGDLSPRYRRRTSEIPWRYLADTSDRLRHQYLDVDRDLLWEIVTQRVPPLIPQLEKLLVRA